MDPRNTGPASKDDGYDVSDPTDWLETPLTGLMQVEQSLRCHVCKDFFNSPVITSCSHTFCSLCIRRALNTDGKCPLCRATDQESKLRGNWAIREVVESFVSVRNAALEFARHQPPAPNVTPPSTAKRKAGEGPVDGESTGKRTRRSTRSTSARAAATTTAMMEQEADLPEAEEAEEYVPDDGLVACPICQWRMKPEKVDRHLDTDCPGEPRPQPNPSKTKTFGLPLARSSGTPPSASYERLPSTNYSLLNETKLRKKMADIGIPTWGSRLLMEKRHREWVMIWNANCDSSRPKTKRELLQDLDTWERTQGGHAPTMSISANLGVQIKDKDFDGAGWSAKHSNSFHDLISQARRSQKKVADRPVDTEPTSKDARDSEIPQNDGAHHKQPAEVESTARGSVEDSLARHSEMFDLTPQRRRDEGGHDSLPRDDQSTLDAIDVTTSTVTGAPI